MTNHSCEGAVSNQSKAFVSLQKEIERQKQKIIDAEHNSSAKAASISKLKESLNMVMKMTDKEYTLHEECHKDLQQMKVMNSNMSHEMECIKKEHEQITKELEECKSLNDLQQKNFTEEIRKSVMKISSLQMDALKQEKDHKNVLKLAEDLKGQNEQLNAKIIQLERQQKHNSWLTRLNIGLKRKLDVMEQMEDEFLKMVGHCRKINSWCKYWCEENGELDTRPFLKAMRAKKIYNEEDAALRALEMCSMWEKYLADPHWHPFKIITVDGKSKEIIDDGDAKLEKLKKEMGVGAYKAVVEALTEMNEYNPSGRFVISELWNYRVGRSATLEEGVKFLLGQRKSKKQKIHQTGKQHNHYKSATITKCKNAGHSSGEDSDGCPLSFPRRRF
ncbi:putative domain XH [Sesbania bispinosa]|nr:putative domain XH [Sesbania bispinosa]